MISFRTKRMPICPTLLQTWLAGAAGTTSTAAATARCHCRRPSSNRLGTDGWSSRTYRGSQHERRYHLVPLLHDVQGTRKDTRGKEGPVAMVWVFNKADPLREQRDITYWVGDRGGGREGVRGPRMIQHMHLGIHVPTLQYLLCCPITAPLLPPPPLLAPFNTQFPPFVLRAALVD